MTMKKVGLVILFLLVVQIATFSVPIASASHLGNQSAGICYRSNTGTNTNNSPKFRIFHGANASLGAEQELATSGSPIRQCVLAWSPVSKMCAIVTSSDDGNLDAYASADCESNSVSWTTSNNFAYIRNVTVPYTYRPFDIAFENKTGDLLIVWAPPHSNAIDFQYITLANGQLDVGAQTISDLDFTTTSGNLNTTWVNLERRYGTTCNATCNDIVLYGLETLNTDAIGVSWDGNANTWENQTLVWTTPAGAGGTPSGIAFESGSIHLRNSTGLEMLASQSDTATVGVVKTFRYNFNSGAWTANADVDYGAGSSVAMTVRCDWLSNNGCFSSSVDSQNDYDSIHTANTNTVTLHTQTDAAVDSASARPADFMWAGNNSTGLQIWGTASGSFSYRKFTAPNTFGTAGTVSSTNLHHWFDCRTNPRTADTLAGLCIVNEDSASTTPNIILVTWNGGGDAPVVHSTPTSDTGTGATPLYMAMWIEFQLSTTTMIQSVTRTISDTVVITDSISRLQVLPRTISDTIIISESIQRILLLTRSLTVSVIISDSIEAIKVVGSSANNITFTLISSYSSIRIPSSEGNAFNRLLSITVAITDSITRIFTGERALLDIVAITDSIDRIFAQLRGLTDTLGVSDIILRVFDGTRNMLETNIITDSIERIGVFFRSTTDITVITDSIDRMGVFTRTTGDTVIQSLTMSIDIVKQTSDNVLQGDNINRVFSGTRLLSESSIITDPLQRIYFGVRGLSITTSISDSVSRTQLVFVSMVESVIGSDNLQRIYIGTRGIVESSTITDTVNRVGVFSRGIIDSVIIPDSLQRIGDFVRSMVDTIIITDMVEAIKITAQNYDRLISDTVVITDIVARMFVGTRGLSDSVTIADSIEALRAQFVTLVETIIVSDSIQRIGVFTREMSVVIDIAMSVTGGKMYEVLLTDTVIIITDVIRSFGLIFVNGGSDEDTYLWMGFLISMVFFTIMLSSRTRIMSLNRRAGYVE